MTNIYTPEPVMKTQVMLEHDIWEGLEGCIYRCRQVKQRPDLPFLETNTNIIAEIPLLALGVQLVASSFT
jgi:hypothetical protein